MRESAIVMQSRVVEALILRDVKTRFGGNPVLFLVSIGWPLAHIGLLVGIYAFTGRVAPVGSSAVLFFSAGVLPFMVFSYPTRFVMSCVTMNEPLLGFPIVSLADILLARAILELIAAFAVVLLCGLVLFAIGIDIEPLYPAEAVSALITSIALALGLGMLNALLAKKWVFWRIIVVFFIIALYLSSGIIFLPEVLPHWALDIAVWNPLLHIVTWFRAAYYEGYGVSYLDRQYPIVLAVVSIWLAFTCERLFRRFWLS